ncbi:prephenate dehydrogenase [Boudabousia tangfeifanii]|uniref:Prephenate dehydrogenase n=2 Tax=Boudabousia tangfeifanii TaxID=1912795 RepID=A0A1D9MMD9_9ACTO|nr:prephenate dehydrogenase [Boudabousia tangfeifanii]AOZ73467.1 prephenate dehydrogenase [Boudabousia tangfeifanii]
MPAVAATKGPVLVVGTGLIGTSIALALTRLNVPVWLQDLSPTAQALAADMGAGSIYQGDDTPSLVIVATGPDVTAKVVCDCLDRFPNAIVTDVASVKEAVVAKVEDHPQASRYVGSHPMAGREVAGPAAADADLFQGRPWVCVPTEASSPTAFLAVRELATDVGAIVSQLPAKEHDQAVALVSHVPQLVSSALAARLAQAAPNALSLAGGGLRDTTRIAASDPRLWTAILGQNAKSVASVLGPLVADLNQLLSAFQASEEATVALPPGLLGAINQVMLAGNEGVKRIPGKHGDSPIQLAEVGVLVPDKPGELGRLFAEVGDAGINIEDLRIEHSVGQQVGLVWLSVAPVTAQVLSDFLTNQNWRVVLA